MSGPAAKRKIRRSIASLKNVNSYSLQPQRGSSSSAPFDTPQLKGPLRRKMSGLLSRQANRSQLTRGMPIERTKLFLSS